MNTSNAFITLGRSTLQTLLNATDNATVLPSTKGVRLSPRVPVVSVVSFVLGVIGNILAICVIFRSRKRHRLSVFHRLVVTLAFTDLFGIITTSPVVFAVFSGKVSLKTSESLCNYMAFMMIFAGLATVLIVGAMALDRYFAVLLPFKYKSVKKVFIVNLVISGIWLFSLLLSALPLIGVGENVVHYPWSWCFYNFFGDRVEDKIYGYLYSILGLGIICLTAIMNLLVIVGIISGRSVSRRGSISNKKSRSRKDISMSVFLVAIVLVFAVCWAPFMIRLIINQSRTVKRNNKADLNALILASWNQVLDPWVYLLFRHEMLKRFVHLVEKSRGGSALRRLVSLTGSFRSTSSGSEMTQNTESRQVQIDSCVGEEMSSKNGRKTETTDVSDERKPMTTDVSDERKPMTTDVSDERMIQDKVSISDEV
ncbi:prostaglandin E2 receptor EP2 subtype-like isoform X2 [Mytilus galloprovincialis]|uniref:prostaglandin E2 receptor EP2 subtype-like isoform X2 n=1 Tax=Mytilus galloprovincialis TaxID=29158 RepID=UPI003F7B6F4F